MKKLDFLTPGLFLLIVLAMGCTQKPVVEGIQTSDQLKQFFADPPSEYRSAPLWDWNEQISEEGIDFQMKEFKKASRVEDEPDKTSAEPKEENKKLMKTLRI